VTLKFGTDGVRGVALVELTPSYTTALGEAAAHVIGGDRWLVARDTRESGPELEAALAAGLRSRGATVELLGVLPTPALAHLAALEEVPAAMITASHNRFTDNGVKLFAAGGRKLDDDVETHVEAQVEIQAETRLGDALTSLDATQGDGGRITARDGAVAAYVDHLVALFPPQALAGMRITLDCANGAMSEAAPLALRALGADATVIHASPDGRNINDSCGATAPGALSRAVVESGDELGLALDGDGDRVVAADHLGRVVDGDHLLALEALRMHAAGELVDDTLVVTVMSNLGLRLAMQRAGIRVAETAVGDRYVLEVLHRDGYTLGGEQSGHIIFPRLATTGDGLLAGLRLAHHVRESGRPLAELAAAAMTALPQVLVNVRVAERHPDVGEELASEIAHAEASMGGEGRVLVRASGTEPLVRVMVEAPSAEQARRVADDLASVVQARWAAPAPRLA
jgi:phosphoglucosamine mutase